MTWLRLKGDARIAGPCAVPGCAGWPMFHLEAEGFGETQRGDRAIDAEEEGLDRRGEGFG